MLQALHPIGNANLEVEWNLMFKTVESQQQKPIDERLKSMQTVEKRPDIHVKRCKAHP